LLFQFKDVARQASLALAAYFDSGDHRLRRSFEVLTVFTFRLTTTSIT
jgi:hypothetical protein